MADVPKYFYPLYKPQDWELFELLIKCAKDYDFPKIGGIWNKYN